MAPPKKMTLQEFFTDESLGGSWADDDIDLSSISVPIEKHRHNYSYSNDPFGHNSSSNGYNHSYSRHSMPQEYQAPYIVKLLNLPVTCNDSFIEDLFKSRYTPYQKCKIIVDPSTNILETHIVRKIAFVELHSSQDLSKVLKWQDLYYRASRRVIVELADFEDFQNSLSFTKEHEEEILKIEQEFLSGKHQPHQQYASHSSAPRHINQDHVPSSSPQSLNSAIKDIQQSVEKVSLQNRAFQTSAKPVASTPSAPHKPKVNPFGAAKPVDVVAKSHEIDKKLVAVNHTTIKTLGAVIEEEEKEKRRKPNNGSTSRRGSQTDSRRSSINLLKRPPASAIIKEGSTDSDNKVNELSNSVYSPNNGISLADLLSSKHGSDLISVSDKSTPRSAKNSARKPPIIKTVILKKKSQKNPDVDTTSVEVTETAEAQSENENAEKSSKSELSVNKVENINQKEDEKLTKDRSSAIPIHNNIKPDDILKEDRPNFKKHLNDLIKKPLTSKRNIKNKSDDNFKSGRLPHEHPTDLSKVKFKNGRKKADKNTETNSNKGKVESSSNEDTTENESEGHLASSNKDVNKGKEYSKYKNNTRTSNQNKHSEKSRKKLTDKNPEKRGKYNISDKKNATTPESQTTKTTSAEGRLEPSPEVPNDSGISTKEDFTSLNGVDDNVSESIIDDNKESSTLKGNGGEIIRGGSRGSSRGSVRGRGRRGRGRGRGRGNFNLHYVRNKTENASSET